MKKYNCYAVIGASKYIGVIEANNKTEAIEKAELDAEAPTLCHNCAHAVDLGDVIRIDAELI